MNKNTFTSVKLTKGEMNTYDFGDITLHAYKTNDFIDDEVFILVKNGKGVAIELPCFFDNIKELTAFLKENGNRRSRKARRLSCRRRKFFTRRKNLRNRAVGKI